MQHSITRRAKRQGPGYQGDDLRRRPHQWRRDGAPAVRPAAGWALARLLREPQGAGEGAMA